MKYLLWSLLVGLVCGLLAALKGRHVVFGVLAGIICGLHPVTAVAAILFFTFVPSKKKLLYCSNCSYPFDKKYKSCPQCGEQILTLSPRDYKIK